MPCVNPLVSGMKGTWRYARDSWSGEETQGTRREALNDFNNKVCHLHISPAFELRSWVGLDIELRASGLF